jgi:hypothetical protein
MALFGASSQGFFKLDVGIANLIIVGSKSDLPAEVTEGETRLLCTKINAEYIETSAKLGTHIDALFQLVAKKVAASLDDIRAAHHRTSDRDTLLLSTGPAAGTQCTCFIALGCFLTKRLGRRLSLPRDVLLFERILIARFRT